MTNSMKDMVKLTVMMMLLGLVVMVGIKVYFETKPIMIQYYGEIGGDVQYFRLLTTLREANYGQRIDIYMLSPGGSVLHGNELAGAMRESKGYVVYHVGSLAASMAAVMACQADKLVLAPHAVIMYHTIQTDEGAVINPTEPDLQAFLKAAKILTEDCTFLTADEKSKIWSGGEVWLTGDEVNRRMSKG